MAERAVRERRDRILFRRAEVVFVGMLAIVLQFVLQNRMATSTAGVNWGVAQRTSCEGAGVEGFAQVQRLAVDLEERRIILRWMSRKDLDDKHSIKHKESKKNRVTLPESQASAELHDLSRTSSAAFPTVQCNR